MKPASSTITDYVAAESRLAYEIHEFVRQGIDLETTAVEARDDDYWKGTRPNRLPPAFVTQNNCRDSPA